MVLMPSRRAVLMMRQAISPRLAIRSLENMRPRPLLLGRFLEVRRDRVNVWRLLKVYSAASGSRRRPFRFAARRSRGSLGPGAGAGLKARASDAVEAGATGSTGSSGGSTLADAARARRAVFWWSLAR